MPLKLDHIVITVDNLDKAIQDYRDLGFTVSQNSTYRYPATRNALIFFMNGTCIELLAADESETTSPFKQLVDRPQGLAGYALQTSDIEAEIIRLRELGFTVSNAATHSYHHNNREIRWKTALIDNAFTPFLIQDVTPREWRVIADTDLTTHDNRSIGLQSVEVVVKNIQSSRERYAELVGIKLKENTAHHRTIGDIVLSEYSGYYSLYSLENLPDYLRPFGGNATQEEVDNADVNLEPLTFKSMLKVKPQSLERFKQRFEEEQAMVDALSDSDEVLFAVHLVREQSNQEQFTPEPTHGVWFKHLTGTPPYRGMHILDGLDEIDWSAVSHAYGEANDVPNLLRDLTSDDESVRNHAHQTLIGSIVHQGTIYEASIEAIPFLVRLLVSPDIDKSAPINLLIYIPSGGLETPELSERSRIVLDEVYSTFIENISYADTGVRESIAELLGLYPNKVDELTPILQQQIEQEADAIVRETFLRSLARIWTKASSAEKLSNVQETYIANMFQDGNQYLSVRFRAAIVLLKNNRQLWQAEVTKFFYDMMNNDEATLRTLNSVWLGGIFYDVTDALSYNHQASLDWVIAQAQHPVSGIREQVPTALGELVTTEKTIQQTLPVVRQLLTDKSPDVRQAVFGFFHSKPYVTKQLEDLLRRLAEHDPSVTIRTIAKNALRFMK